MTATPTARPAPAEYAPYYETYIRLVPEADVLPVLEAQVEETLALLRNVPEAVANTRHPPYTWSVKEVIGHLTDAERVFGYRALRIARGDPTPLPGFDENAYVRAASFDARPLPALLAEFEAVRRSHLHLFRSLDDAAWRRDGVANDNRVSVRALAWILAGHVRHHLAILRKRLASA